MHLAASCPWVCPSWHNLSQQKADLQAITSAWLLADRCPCLFPWCGVPCNSTVVPDCPPCETWCMRCVQGCVQCWGRPGHCRPSVLLSSRWAHSKHNSRLPSCLACAFMQYTALHSFLTLISTSVCLKCEVRTQDRTDERSFKPSTLCYSFKSALHTSKVCLAALHGEPCMKGHHYSSFLI